MDLFQSSYFSTRRRFLLLIGQWPYDDSTFKSIQRFIVTAFVGSFIQAQIFKFFTNEWSVDLCIEIIPNLLFFTISMVKYTSYWRNGKLLKYVCANIKNHWTSTDVDEINILRSAILEANHYSLLTTMFCYGGICLFLMLPYIPIVLDILVPLNESRPYQPLFPAEYFVDSKEYFFPILMHMQISTIIAITVVVGVDTMSSVIFLHIYGMFNVIGHWLEHLFDSNMKSSNDIDYYSVILTRIMHIVEYHKKVIKYVEIVQSCLAGYYVFEMFLAVMFIVGHLLQLNQAIFEHEMHMIVFQMFRTSAVFFVVFFNIFPAQKVVDSSEEIFYKAYLGNWYTAPVKIQKILLFIMQKVMTPCTISFGNMVHMSFELYASIVRTTLSYFMAIYSMQCEPS